MDPKNLNELTHANKILQDALNKGDIALFEKAEELFKEFLSKFPNNADANHNLGILYTKRNLHTEALPYLDKSCEIELPIAQFFLSRSSCKYKLKDLSGALNDINQAEKLEPENIKVIRSKGILLRLLGNEENAFPYFLKYTELKSDDIEGLNRLANHYLMSQNYEDAKKICERALEINPNHFEMIINLANLFVKTHERKKAKKLFERALKINPKESFLYLNYGSYYQNANQHVEAIKQYKKGIELGNNTIQLIHNIGTAYGELGSKKNLL